MAARDVMLYQEARIETLLRVKIEQENEIKKLKDDCRRLELELMDMATRVNTPCTPRLIPTTPAFRGFDLI